MPTPPQAEQQAYQETKWEIIGKAFGFVLSGISWLSLDIDRIKPLTLSLGILLLLISLYLIIASYCSRLLSKAETLVRRSSPIFWPILVTSVYVALYQALSPSQMTHDWRVLTLGIVVVMFVILATISLLATTFSPPVFSNIRREYNWVKPLGLVVIVIFFAILISWFDFPFFESIPPSFQDTGQTMKSSVADLLGNLWALATTLHWEAIIGVATILALFVAIATVIYIYKSSNQQIKNLSSQADLIRKQVFSELYDRAQVTDLCFIIPEGWKHPMNNFIQTDKEQKLGKYVAIPLGVEVELHIRWRWAASQTMIGYSVGFKDVTTNSPKISETLSPFQQETYEEFTRERYRDWHGWLHTEYAHLRRFTNNDYFLTTIKVKGDSIGKHILQLEVRVHEAPNYVGTLTLECIDRPNEWAKKYWTQNT